MFLKCRDKVSDGACRGTVQLFSDLALAVAWGEGGGGAVLQWPPPARKHHSQQLLPTTIHFLFSPLPPEAFLASSPRAQPTGLQPSWHLAGG